MPCPVYNPHGNLNSPFNVALLLLGQASLGRTLLEVTITMRYNNFITSSVVASVLLSASSAVLAQYQHHQSASLEVTDGLNFLGARAYQKQSKCWYGIVAERVFVRFMFHRDDGYPLASCGWIMMEGLQGQTGVPRSDTSPVRFASDAKAYGSYCEIMAEGASLDQILTPIKCLMPDGVLPICV